MRDKNGKWGWPRLHLSTAVILFLLSSVAIGVQFVPQDPSINTNAGRDSDSPNFEESTFPVSQFGWPFIVFKSGARIKALHQLEYAWSVGGLFGNAAVLLAALCIVTLILEARVKRQTLNPTPDKV